MVSIITAKHQHVGIIIMRLQILALSTSTTQEAASMAVDCWLCISTLNLI